jgi:hypothetical protein
LWGARVVFGLAIDKFGDGPGPNALIEEMLT